VALVEAGRVRLVWRASDAPDLAGYRVYRLDLRQVKGEYRRLTETAIPEVQYTDSNVTPGVTYVYRITAVDQSGNESDPAEVRATAQ
jgi:fibronectin type 3 domain-containing protein